MNCTAVINPIAMQLTPTEGSFFSFPPSASPTAQRWFRLSRYPFFSVFRDQFITFSFRVDRATLTSPACLDQWEGGTTPYHYVLVGVTLKCSIGITQNKCVLCAHSRFFSPAAAMNHCLASLSLSPCECVQLSVVVLWQTLVEWF